MRCACLLLAMVALSSTLALGKTWYVGGPGADVDEIQPAIDAAQSGDLILVREGTYVPFTLTKGVIIRGDIFFTVSGPPDVVIVKDLPAFERAGISGMELMPTAKI